MPEWSIGAVSKTVVPFRHPGFESLSLRNKSLSNQAFVVSNHLTLVITTLPRIWGKLFASFKRQQLSVANR